MEIYCKHKDHKLKMQKLVDKIKNESIELNKNELDDYRCPKCNKSNELCFCDD
ncbi:MAG TPA: hypothetical protein VIK86_07860 [Candidatus Paceibacterota bacterium]